MIYIVLGMHKSGTTLVSESLHKSGIHMGNFPPELGYDGGNKYEHHEAQATNRKLLNGYLIPRIRYFLSTLKQPVYNQAGYKKNSDSTAIFIRKRHFSSLMRTGDIPTSMHEIIEESNEEFVDWGFKDPRTCYTYGIWKRALPEHRLVVVYRDYQHLLKRYRATPWHPTAVYRILHSWSMHNQFILNYLDTTPFPFLILDYDQLMKGDEEFRRLANFVGHELVDVRKKELYRNTGEASHNHWVNQRISNLLDPSPSSIYEKLVQRRLDNLESSTNKSKNSHYV